MPTTYDSLWPSDGIWLHKSWPTLAQVMMWCLTASSNYFNQSWLIINKIMWPSFDSTFTANTQGSQWVKSSHCASNQQALGTKSYLVGYLLNSWESGPRTNINTVFPSYMIPMLKIRRSRGRLIFNMRIPILVRRHFYIETAPMFILTYLDPWFFMKSRKDVAKA